MLFLLDRVYPSGGSRQLVWEIADYNVALRTRRFVVERVFTGVKTSFYCSRIAELSRATHAVRTAAKQ